MTSNEYLQVLSTQTAVSIGAELCHLGQVDAVNGRCTAHAVWPSGLGFTFEMFCRDGDGWELKQVHWPSLLDVENAAEREAEKRDQQRIKERLTRKDAA